MANPSLDMVNFLAAQSLSLTKGTNLFIGAMQETSDYVPDDAVFVRGAPGSEPVRCMGDTVNFRKALVEILVRWDNFREGDDKSRLILNAIQGASISGYLDVMSPNSEPGPVSEDEQGLHVWQVLAGMHYQEQT